MHTKETLPCFARTSVTWSKVPLIRPVSTFPTFLQFLQLLQSIIGFTVATVSKFDTVPTTTIVGRVSNVQDAHTNGPSRYGPSTKSPSSKRPKTKRPTHKRPKANKRPKLDTTQAWAVLSWGRFMCASLQDIQLWRPTMFKHFLHTSPVVHATH